MKEINTICDVHASKDKHPGVEREITIDGAPYVLDVCDGFMSELRSRSMTNTLEAALTTPNGRRAKQVPAKKAVAAKAAVAGKKTAAPIPVAPPAEPNGMRAADEDFPCFCCPLSLKQGSWPGHARTHGFASSGDMVGDRCPLCNDKHGRLTNHAKEKHGVANVALLFQTAVRDGDKYGIVGKRIKAAQNVKLT